MISKRRAPSSAWRRHGWLVLDAGRLRLYVRRAVTHAGRRRSGWMWQFYAHAFEGWMELDRGFARSEAAAQLRGEDALDAARAEIAKVIKCQEAKRERRRSARARQRPR